MPLAASVFRAKETDTTLELWHEGLFYQHKCQRLASVTGPDCKLFCLQKVKNQGGTVLKLRHPWMKLSGGVFCVPGKMRKGR